jgi:PPE-repeat protein
MDYFALPPEINSGRIWTGPGSAPLVEAATAWGMLSQGLYSAATEFGSATSTLPWTGPSAVAMRTAASRYTGWLTATAVQADTTAAQAASAAAAYEAAWAASVPPAVVAENRAELLLQIATNLLGQNTSTIMALEAEYAEMWAQDVAAMVAYQTASAVSTSGLQPFTPAPQTTNPTNPANASQSAGTAQQVLSLLNPNSVPVFGLDNGSLLGQYAQAFLSSGPWQMPFELLSLFSSMWGMSGATAALTASAQANAAAAHVAAPIARAISAPSVSVRMGGARPIGPLSVPPDWVPVEGRPPVPSTLPGPGRFQTGIPVPPAVPVAGLNRSDQQRKTREQPEYGHVSRILPGRHPSAG